MRAGPLTIMLLCGGLLGCQAASLTSAKLYLEEGETAKAAAKLDAARAQDPDNPEVHFLIGQVAAATGRYGAMDTALAVTADLDSTYTDRIANLRRQYWLEEYNQGVNELTAEPPNLDPAGRAFRHAIRIDPQPIGAWRNLAYVAYHQDSTQVAIRAYEHILRAAASDTVALASLSVDDYDAALPILVDLTERMPDNTLVWRELGRIFAIKGRIEESKRAYDQAESLSP